VVLRAPYGTDAHGKPIGSWLSPEAVATNPSLNFLDDTVGNLVDERLPHGGVFDPVRLRRNMLSSQALCFNASGFLRNHFDPLGGLLGDLLPLEIEAIERVECEWAPPAPEHLGDRTAFDAYIEYRDERGRRCFLGVETKYTEPFSQKEYESEI
jgi:hypothetical protein